MRNEEEYKPHSKTQNVNIPKLFLPPGFDAVNKGSINMIMIDGRNMACLLFDTGYYKFVCRSFKTTAFGQSYCNVLYIGQ